jgi:DNA invertase Pin-like site-specific DNA recombinase
MRKIGYARVSSASQNLDRQLGARRAERCDQIFAEKMSGKSLKGRPQLEKAIDALGTGTSANALPSEPTRAGSRQGDGPGFGRTPKLDDHQQGEALKRLAAGESRRAIARSDRCSHSTIGRLAGD